MVAAGGGGIDCLAGGDGGKLIGKSPANYDPHTIPGPGTQVSGGSAGRHTNLEYGYPGEFGIGGAGMCKTNCDGAGSGGGGYYGGGGMTGGGGGGGGSSFISGYEGCKAIDKITNKSTESPIHYSQLFFRSGRMFAGDEDMPAARSTNTIVGNTGNGFAKITAISLLQTCNKKTSAKTTTLIMLIILATK